MKFSDSGFMGVKFVGAVGQNPPTKNEKSKVCKKPCESLSFESASEYFEIDI